MIEDHPLPTERGLPSGPPLLHLLFDQQAARRPGQVAVRDEHGDTTYDRLCADSVRLADLLRRRCPRPSARIGLHLARGAQVVTAMLAVLRAGHTYVPLDPDYPAERLRFTAQDAELSLILSDRPVPTTVGATPVLRLDRPAAPAPPQAAVAPAVDPGTPAYVIHTSGSTGRPKGVPVPHRNVVALVRACADRYDLGPDDVWTLFHSYAFDFSVWEIWGALLNGATLTVVPQETAASPQETLDLLRREGVTVFNVVPSVFRHLTRAARLGRRAPEALRYVIFGGESIDVRDVRVWRTAVGRTTRFVNTYGITESTVFVTSRPLTGDELDRAPDPDADPDFALDLGEPLDGWELRVLGPDGTDVRPGETGEIVVSGAGLAPGYLGRPELTAERFPELPTPDGGTRRCYRSGDLAVMLPGGTYRYAGRADDQVKINGYRIEPGEVEARLRDAPGVRELAVLRTVSRIGEPALTAFYTAEEPRTDDTGAALAAHARRVLPGYMVPTRFVCLPAFPITPSGKTDRRILATRV
ncbi:amino acid adenylation domain-containing protein [Streptomyces sp. NPDC054863]